MLGDACELRGNPFSGGRSGEQDYARHGGRDVNEERDSGDSCVRPASHRCSGTRVASSALVLHVGELNASPIRVAQIDLVAKLKARLSLGHGGLERSQSAWCVEIVNAEAEVIVPGMLTGFEGVKSEEAVLQAELTEVLVFGMNGQAREQLIERLGARDIGGVNGNVVDCVRPEQRLSLTTGRASVAAAAYHAGGESDTEQSLHELTTAEMAAVIHVDQTLKFVVHMAPEQRVRLPVRVRNWSEFVETRKAGLIS